VGLPAKIGYPNPAKKEVKHTQLMNAYLRFTQMHTVMHTTTAKPRTDVTLAIIATLLAGSCPSDAVFADCVDGGSVNTPSNHGY